MAVELYYDGSKKLETLEDDGVDVTGNVGGDTLNISGVGTISGGLTGNVTGNVTGDLTGMTALATLVNIESLDVNNFQEAILFRDGGNSATTDGRVVGTPLTISEDSTIRWTINYPGGVTANLTGNVTGKCNW